MPGFVLRLLVATGLDFALLYHVADNIEQQGAFLFLLICLLITPWICASAAGDALIWQRRRMGNDGPAPRTSALARLVAVSSLLWLGLCAALALLSGHLDPHNFNHLFLLLILLVNFFRFQHAALINLAASLYVSLFPKRSEDRFYALITAVGAVAGFSLLHWIFNPQGILQVGLLQRLSILEQQPADPMTIVFQALFMLANFGHALVTAGTLLWAMDRRR